MKKGGTEYIVKMTFVYCWRAETKKEKVALFDLN